MSHFTLLRLQLEHPVRDLVWPFRGIGRLLVTVEVSVLGRDLDDANEGVSKDSIEYLGPRLMSKE
jgi:hypothetical protein